MRPIPKVNFSCSKNRQQTGWDRALKGHGMLIYHVDRSQRIVEGYSARDRWTYNMPNDVAGHPCFRLVTARPDSGDGYEAFMPYPGETGNTEFSAASRPAAQSWSGASPAAELYDISESPEGVIRFSVRMAEGSIEDVRIEGRQRAVAGDDSPARYRDALRCRRGSWRGAVPTKRSLRSTARCRALPAGGYDNRTCRCRIDWCGCGVRYRGGRRTDAARSCI